MRRVFLKTSIRIILFYFVVFCFLITVDFRDHANAASDAINLGFEPLDKMHPNEPVVYMTQNGSRLIYAVNYETGVIKTLQLPYIAERLTVYNDKLYVTQLKLSIVQISVRIMVVWQLSMQRIFHFKRCCL